jgi:hypothetical protein
VNDPVSIESGDATGNRAQVNGEGQVATEMTEAAWSVVRSTVTVLTASTTLAAAEPRRRGLRILVLGGNPIYVRFDGTAATNQDWPVVAGGQLVLDHFPCKDAITAIAVGGSSAVLVLEMVSEVP